MTLAYSWLLDNIIKIIAAEILVRRPRTTYVPVGVAIYCGEPLTIFLLSVLAHLKKRFPAVCLGGVGEIIFTRACIMGRNTRFDKRIFWNYTM